MAKGDNPTMPGQMATSFAGALGPSAGILQQFMGTQPGNRGSAEQGPYSGFNKLPMQQFNPSPEADRTNAISPSSGFDLNNRFQFGRAPTMRQF